MEEGIQTKRKKRKKQRNLGSLLSHQSIPSVKQEAKQQPSKQSSSDIWRVLWVFKKPKHKEHKPVHRTELVRPNSNHISIQQG